MKLINRIICVGEYAPALSIVMMLQAYSPSIMHTHAPHNPIVEGQVKLN